MASRLLLKDVQQSLKCLLCTGYLIDATTITECLHTFCKSCLLIYFEKKNHSCPVCGFQLSVKNSQLRLDKTLQDIVYKLIPQLYFDEMSARTKFYADSDDSDVSNWSDSYYSDSSANDDKDDGISSLSSSSSSLSSKFVKRLQFRKRKQIEKKIVLSEIPERTIFSPKDSFSLALVYRTTQRTLEETKQIYLYCPALLRVEHLKKFCFNKFNLSPDAFEIEIFYEQLPLLDCFTLMDIAYISHWKQTAPLRLYFTFYRKPKFLETGAQKCTKIKKVSRRCKLSSAVKANKPKLKLKPGPKKRSDQKPLNSRKPALSAVQTIETAPKLEEDEDMQKKKEFFSSINLICKDDPKNFGKSSSNNRCFQ